MERSCLWFATRRDRCVVAPGTSTGSQTRKRAIPTSTRSCRNVREPRHRVAIRVEITRPRILDVGDRRLRTPCDTGDRGDQAADVSFGRVDAGACSHCSRHPCAVTLAHLVAEVDYFVLCEAEEPHHVRVGAEAAVPHTDPRSEEHTSE